VQAMKDATDGRGADVVVETVGEATWERSLAAASHDGRIVVCGATSGHSPPARLYRLWWKQLVVYGSTMGMPSDFEGAYELVRSGRARVHVDSVYPLFEAAQAHERLEAGTQFGKVVLSIPSEAALSRRAVGQ
jgi:NADPH:quinone reductase-like Zn-dependent oxidoreductase